MIHPNALCESDTIGAGTRIWAFAHVLDGAVIGRDCNISDGVFIEGDVIVGDRVTVKCGVQLWDGTRIGSDVSIGPNVTFTNDPFIRSPQRLDAFPLVTVEDGASLGANCTILPRLTIGSRAMVSPGAVVTRDVPANAVVRGNPARVVGYVDELDENEQGQRIPSQSGPRLATGVRLVELTHAVDMRGQLTAIEYLGLPFVPSRTFVVYDVPASAIRGAHAHRACEQLLVCIRGSVECIVDDGAVRAPLVLDRPDVGLFVPHMTWATQQNYSRDAVLMVLASHPYDPDDYITDYAEFRREHATVRSVP